MMCCYRINTEVLLANLFVNSEYPVDYTYDDVHNYFRYMAEKFPTYLCTDLSEQALYDCGAEYPDIYTVYRSKDGKVTVRSKEYKPNLDYFNVSYSYGLRNYMEYVTKEYLAED